LDRAIEIVKDKLQVSAYPENFKSRIIAEISALKDADLFRYIPEIIILPSLGNSDTEGGGKDVIADDQTFMSLGGMTWLKPNAAVIFSNRAKQYTAEDLAELLLHEVIHHVVSNSLSRDEDFVEELAGSIISGQKNSKLEQALQIGAYFRQELISADQLWDAIESDRSEAEGLSLFAYVNKRFICGIFAGNLRGPDCVQEMLDFQKAYVVSHLPHNLIDVRVGKVWQVLNEANYAAFQRGSSIGNMVVGAFLTSYMNRLAKKTNPQAPDLQFEKHIFGGTQVKNSKQINNLLMKEYFLPKQR
jgi:hypothetical protein